MKARIIGYWILTALTALALLPGGVFDAIGAKEALDALKQLGFPAWFATLIGVWKILATLAILAPRLPRLKEWAYAGVFFDFTGASIAHAAAGNSAGDVIFPVVLTLFTIGSWWLRPDSRKLAGPLF
jgi:uncharacterized membrane protein YphA (DoxX/SURF4 family)